MRDVRHCVLDGGGLIGGSAASGEGLPEIAIQTKLRSQPHKLLTRVFPGNSEKLPVSPVKMLLGREGNHSARAKFTSSDRCHLSSRYLPVNGPSVIDRMDSCAYVSQFSADGTLFIAGFQVQCATCKFFFFFSLSCDIDFDYVLHRTVILRYIVLMMIGKLRKIYAPEACVGR